MQDKRCSLQLGWILSASCFSLAGTLLYAQDIKPPVGDDAVAPGKLHPSLMCLLHESSEPVKAWVFFTDKGVHTPRAYATAIRQVASTYNPRAVERRTIRSTRALRGEPIFNEHDLPVVEAYVDAVKATGVEVHVTSRWINAVSVIGMGAQFAEIARLPFVKKLQPVARSVGVRPPKPERPIVPRPVPPDGDRGGRLDYGLSHGQLLQMNLIALHDAGYTGEGVIVGMLDTGFLLTHEAYNDPANPLTVVAAWDFLNNDPNVGPEEGESPIQHDHGTKTLSCLGAYKPGSLVGGAYDASFILAKTEDTTGEYPAEEDNFVAGLEFIEMNGADMSSASLGYDDWYTPDDMDGQTAVTTIAVNISTSLGVHHCNSAGNSGHDGDPTTNTLIAPSDGFQVITCGAVYPSGEIVSFSSDGPSADGRVKPELLAQGFDTAVVLSSSDTEYTLSNGTSLSAPLVAASVACLIQAKPYWTVDQMRERLFETATDFVASGTHDPFYIRGYGIIDAYAAYDTCSDAGVVELCRAKYMCESTAEITVNDCGLNTNDDVVEFVIVDVESDSESVAEQVTLTETYRDSAEFVSTIDLSATNAPGVLRVVEGDTVTVTYVDADDGMGGVNVVVTATAIVDCTSPVISNIHTTNVEPHRADVTFDSDEPVVGTVSYGLSCGLLSSSASSSVYSTSPTIRLTGLQDFTTYFYALTTQDEAGNPTSDDNGGNCYSFATPVEPDYFTQQFTEDFDLDGLSLTFTPNGSDNFYRGCAEEIDELPTDPSDGTPLDFAPNDDDGYANLNLAGGATVSIFGTAYGTFHPGTNGYITFGTGDTENIEYLYRHFDLPRVSALFDDLNPSAAGTVSWKQLANRAVVTWENVPKYYMSGSNTFQIELFFDGAIRISYLGITNTEGIVGLSGGGGEDPDFFESDLSTMGLCASPGDCDADGELDADDHAVIIDCFTGSGGTIGPECACADLDQDGDVDCRDLDLFAQWWAGPGDPPPYGPCVEPNAWAEGSRYLAVTPIAGSDPVALLITGDPENPAVSCISRYVQADGTLGETPVFRLPAGIDGWDTVHVFGEGIAPDTLYNVRGDYGSPGEPLLSPAQSVTTPLWGEIEVNGIINFTDVQWLVLGFEGADDLASFEVMNIAPCDLDDAINFTDIQAAILSFEGTDYWDTVCASPCP